MRTTAGPGGRCCHFKVFDSNGFKGYVLELSLILCATGQEFVQLGKTLKAVLKNRSRKSLFAIDNREPVADALKNLTSKKPFVRPSGAHKYVPSKTASISTYNESKFVQAEAV